MWIGLLVSVAAANGWTESAQSDGCTFYTGARQGEYAPVRAVCQWDIPPEKLQGLVARSADHDKYFSSVSVAEQVEAGRFRQVHQASGISDRELIVDMGQQTIPGGVRYWWKKSADQSGVSGDNVEVVVDTGKWEITASEGGSKVIYELMYDPGGSVPGFLVRWFQTSGTQQLVGELYAYAKAH